jgi:hypothetical protein
MRCSCAHGVRTAYRRRLGTFDRAVVLCIVRWQWPTARGRFRTERLGAELLPVHPLVMYNLVMGLTSLVAEVRCRRLAAEVLSQRPFCNIL